MSQTLLKKFQLKYFKAIRNSQSVEFGPLTVFIGNNGSGKSSLIEGLETVQTIAERGLDEAMHAWRGFENIWYKGITHRIDQRFNPPRALNPMSFGLEVQIRPRTRTIKAKMDISLGLEDQLFIYYERVTETYYSLEAGKRVKHEEIEERKADIEPDKSILQKQDFLKDWQFVSLAPQAMGEPKPQKRTGGPIRLNKDGSNIAEYLLSIRNLDQSAYEGILETLQYVLPYASDIQAAITSELERNVYLQLTEADFKVPGWLLSTGTLRVLALLALLRHPNPPSLLVIEEIENGLDPRTINLIVEEIRNVTQAGRMQVVVTTHSPYLLDLLSLSHLVLVERVEGEPTFVRPANKKELQNWVKQFSPGQLYTMGKLSAGSR